MANKRRQEQRKKSLSHKQVVVAITAVAILSFCYLFRFTVYGDVSPFYTSPQTLQSPSSSSIISSWNATITKPNVAVIIESRPLMSLAPLILHFASVLGPEWPIILFTSPKMPLPSSAPFNHAIETGAIQIRYLPPTIQFHVRDEVSEFLTSSWLWEDLSPASHVLLFQTDSILCANSPLTMEDFLRFDFIGAPINPNLGRNDNGMNGGLSLRNRTLILNIIERWSWKKEREVADDPMYPSVAYEDQWFYKKMININEEATKTNSTNKIWVNLPTQEEAMKFAVETIWYDRPLGYHQVASWQVEHLEEVDAWCPEYRMATDEKMHNAGE